MEAKYKEKKVVVPEERELTSTNTSHNYLNERELNSIYISHKYSNEKELLKEASYKKGESLEKNQTPETSSKGKRVFFKKVERISLILK